MATNFIFPRNPKIGDRIEIVSISQDKLPINLVGNAEANKPLSLVFPDQTYTGNADGLTVIATITDKNIVYGFRCVSVSSAHVWLMEDTALKSMISALESRVAALELAAGGSE